MLTYEVRPCFNAIGKASVGHDIKKGKYPEADTCPNF